MKLKNIFLLLLLLAVTASFAQKKTRKQLREVRKIEKQKQTAALVDMKSFIFVARTAMPQGFNTIDLTLNPNYVQFEPDKIKSKMPFFGIAYSGIGYGRDVGLHFEGRPQKFTVKKSKKAYQIDVSVKGETDFYHLLLTVFFEGNATLSVNSNNRSSISYNGEIRPIEEKKISD